MSTSALGPDGRLLIPREIRDVLGLEAGDRVAFVVEADGRVSLRPLLIDVRDLRGLLSGGRRPVSVEGMDQAIRRGASGRSP